jgi:hypothetical protein
MRHKLLCLIVFIISLSNSQFGQARTLPRKRLATSVGGGGGGGGGTRRNGIAIPKASSPLAPKADEDVPVTVKGIKFGAGFGISTYLQNVYSYALTAPAYSLSKERISPVAGVASGIIIINKSVSYLDRSGEVYTNSYPFSLLLSVNLTTFAANATSSASGFNTRLDLGAGVGYLFNDNIQIGLFLDLTSQRFLRDVYDQYDGKPLPTYVANQNLTVLDQADEHYFISHTVPSVSLKVVFTLTSVQPSETKVRQANQFAKVNNSFR